MTDLVRNHATSGRASGRISRFDSVFFAIRARAGQFTEAAKAHRKVFRSSDTGPRLVVTDGGDTVSSREEESEAERAAIAAGQNAKVEGGLGQASLQNVDVESLRSAARTPHNRSTEIAWSRAVRRKA